jgi:hypothetical protein
VGGNARLTRVAGNANAVLVFESGTALLPGASVTVDLAFRSKFRHGLRFTPQVLAGAGLG